MISLPHVAQRIFNTPLAICPQKAEIIVSALEGRFGGIDVLNGAGSLPYNFQAKVATTLKPNPNEKAYSVEEGVAIIPVSGTLVHKSGWAKPTSGMTGYDGIRSAFACALSDSSVRGIVLDIDSPGGEVSGCFDLADEIYRARGTKPIMAILSEMAFSAAYAIASSADVITVPRSGGTGSIGVIAMHADYSKRLENEGVKVTLIRYGKFKADGNETQPLGNDALGRIQADVNRMGEMFIGLVARNRGLSKKIVRGMEAGVYMGQDGVDAGLADDVLAPEYAFEAFLETL